MLYNTHTLIVIRRILELCKLGGGNLVVMNGTWKPFMKFIASLSQSIPLPLANEISETLLLCLATKIRVQEPVDASNSSVIKSISIYMRFFSAHLITLVRLFPQLSAQPIVDLMFYSRQ